MKEEQIKSSLKEKEVETQLLFQGYARQVSMAHTIFETYWQIVLAILFGNFTIFSFVFDRDLLPWNKFYFYNLIILNLFLIMIPTIIAFYIWYTTRIDRIKIVTQIKRLNIP